MSDENLRDAGRHADAVGDTNVARTVAMEVADRQDRARLTPEAAAASIARRHAANAPTAAKAGDSISRHVSAPVSVDIFETGAGQLDIGPNNNRTVYDLHRQDGKWYAEHMQGPSTGGQLSATTLPDLARKIADRHGVSGTVSIEDERGKGKSLSQRFEHTASTTPARGSIEARIAAAEKRVETLRGRASLAREARGNTGARIQSSREQKANSALSEANNELRQLRQQRDEQAAPAAPERAPRTEPFNPRVANGGNLPPRREGENDTMYSVRVASSEDSARRILDGYSLAGLRALARDAGFSPRSGASKATLVELLLEPRRRYWDSIALEGRGPGKA